jgi:hypothetical protein
MNPLIRHKAEIEPVNKQYDYNPSSITVDERAVGLPDSPFLSPFLIQSGYHSVTVWPLDACFGKFGVTTMQNLHCHLLGIASATFVTSRG